MSSSLLPILSQRAWDVLEPLIGPCVEALPVRHPSGKPHYFLNLLELTDCIDHDKTEGSRSQYDDSISWIYAFAFKPGSIKGKPIFRTPLNSGADLIISEDFRQLVEANGLKGLIFDERAAINLVGEKKKQPSGRAAAGQTSSAFSAQATPRKPTDGPITPDELTAVADQINHARKELGLKRAADPDIVQRKIYDEINRVRQNHASFDRNSLDNVALGLGCLWGQTLCDALGWRWADITVGDAEGVGVISPTQSHVVFPMSYINGLVSDPASEQTSLLTYNMLKARSFAGAPGSYTVVG